MNASYQRAMVLYEQGRYADAEREFRVSLAAEPHDPFAHAMLALSLTQRKDKDARALAEATYEAEQAIGLAPHEPFPHYARAQALYHRDRFEEAEAAVAEALRLDAHNPAFFSLLSAVRFAQRRWADALQAAEQGLALDPEHGGCVNLRAMALVKLGRKAEAGETIRSALARDPEDALAHANQGWTLLHQGNHRKALEHFREALRLDPELEWARSGIVEALKARYLVYRLMLRYFLWMSRLSGQAQWVIIIGGYVGYRALGNLARSNPDLAPYVRPVLFAYLAFVVLSWLADPLFNLLLRLNRFGRLVLSDQQRLASNVIGGLLLAAAVSVAAGLLTGSFPLLILALVFGLLMLPTAGVFRVTGGWPKVVMIAACSVLAMVGLSAVATMYAALGAGADLGGELAEVAVQLLQAFGVGILLATLGYNWLRGVRTAK